MENIDTVKEAGYGKHIVSYLIDAAIAIIIGGTLFGTVTSTTMLASLGGDEAAQNFLAIAADSGLFEMETADDGSYLSATPYSYQASLSSLSSGSEQSAPGYELYFSCVWNYYTVFLPKAIVTADNPTPDGRIAPLKDASGNPFSSKEQYYAYFDQSVLGLPDPTLYDTHPSGSDDDPLLYTGASYYRYSLSDDKQTIDLAKKPVLQSSVQAKVDAGDEATLEELNEYFYVPATSASDASGLYAAALNDLEGLGAGASQSYYAENYSRYDFAYYLCVLTAFLPLEFIVFFFIPLFMPNGETLGKKLMGLAVVGKDGLRLRPWQRILRPLAVTVLNSLFLLPYVSSFALMLFVILALVDYMMLMLSKSHQSLHDKLTQTIVADAKHSTFFATPEDKAAYAAGLQAAKGGSGTPAQPTEILDLSTIDQSREEARKMGSFDEFEQKKGNGGAPAAPSQPAVNLTKEEETPKKKDS
jgi:uncharacterized RDD family membrane protein YckC